jgi:two-component system, NarL family, response regulator NreC
MRASAGGDSITVVLADDHTVMRSGLRLLLDAENDLDVRAEAGDIKTTFSQVRGHRPTVLVLDLNMPGGSSIAAIPRLKLMSPATAIVVLTMEADAHFARDAIQAGASGYVLKHAAGTELVRAIRKAATGSHER